MGISREYWSEGRLRFSEKPDFHPFEVRIRLGFGVIFIKYAGQTLYPAVMLGFGYLLVAVGTGLLITPPALHRKFAVWSAGRFRSIFRLAGMGSFFVGLFITFAAVA